MNIGALKALALEYELIIEQIESLGQALHNLHFDASREPSLLRLSTMSYIGWSLPFFYRLYTPDSIPSSCASLSKVCHGLLTLCTALSHKTEQFPLYSTSDDFYEYAINEKLLTGRTEVCAGSPHMIKKLINAMLATTHTCSQPSIPSLFSAHDIVSFSTTRRTLELLCIAFEIARCLFFLTQGVPLNGIRHHYCFPFVRDIQHALKNGAESLYLAHHHARQFSTRAAPSAFSVFFEQSEELIKSKTINAQQFQGLTEDFIQLINILERELSAIITEADAPHSYSYKDIEIFFGPLI